MTNWKTTEESKGFSFPSVTIALPAISVTFIIATLMWGFDYGVYFTAVNLLVYNILSKGLSIMTSINFICWIVAPLWLSTIVAIVCTFILYIQSTATKYLNRQS